MMGEIYAFVFFDQINVGGSLFSKKTLLVNIFF